MSESSISYLKNHLPELVHKAEIGQDIKITRHGKPVAVIVSLERYEKNYNSEQGLFGAYVKWRNQYPSASGFTDAEIAAMRVQTSHQDNSFSWD